MENEQPVTVICRYSVKPGHEAEMERLLGGHWSALRGVDLVTEEPAVIYKGLPSQKPGGSDHPGAVYVEIFSWNSEGAPQTAHHLPEVMAVWEPMGAICDQMDFPHFRRISPVAH